ncbi:hypothetical protein B296_00049511 [Ensete ventricosum]|uniref:Uncharacterized protein n=1 Tax=Ensete ventricosum TaxID=4639 RepID=A0A426Y6X1_ENSVE|nr:hypothetical protein B296_00049511 [Ensete ventricosum]
MATSSPVPLSLINRATPKLPDPISFTSSYFSIISPAKVRPQEGERRSRVLRELQRRGGGGRRKREDEGTRCEETLGYIYPNGLPSTHNRENTREQRERERRHMGGSKPMDGSENEYQDGRTIK